MTCYQPGRSKTLSERGCTGFTLFPENDNGLQCLVKVVGRWSKVVGRWSKVVGRWLEVVEGGRKVVLGP